MTTQTNTEIDFESRQELILAHISDARDALAVIRDAMRSAVDATGRMHATSQVKEAMDALELAETALLS